MKLQSMALIVIAALSHGCASVRPLTCAEHCSLKSMICSGEASGTTQSSGLATIYRSGSFAPLIVPVSSEEEFTQFICKVPEKGGITQPEASTNQDFDSLRDSALQKINHNERAQISNIGWVTFGTGYGLGSALGLGAGDPVALLPIIGPLQAIADHPRSSSLETSIKAMYGITSVIQLIGIVVVLAGNSSTDDLSVVTTHPFTTQDGGGLIFSLQIP